MPTYRVTDPTTGKTLKLTGDSPPSEPELEQIFSGVKAPVVSPPPSQPEVPEWGRNNPNLYGVAGAARESLGPALEALGIGGGAVAGTALGGPMGGVTGAGLGYAGAKNLLESVDTALGNTPGKSLKQQVQELPSELATGSAMEAVPPIAGKGLAFAGRGARQFLGSTTGAGPGMIEEALKGSPAFKDAMRGKTSGEEIVGNVNNALQAIKEQRGATYRSQLDAFSKIKGELNVTPITSKLEELFGSYKVTTKYNIPEEFAWAENNPQMLKQLEAQGLVAKELDFSGSKLATDKNAQSKVKEIYNVITNWKDKSPSGIDTLKQALDNEYSDNSAVRQFVAAIRNRTKDVLVSNVPKYAQMTKGYADATNMIKDMEKSLMLGKGKTEDQTLRRLTSAMRENFEMRRDLLDTLGAKSGNDLAGQVAGYSASQIMPRGLVGKIAGGSFGALTYLNPKFWPLLAASSPRAVGEFMNVYGKALAESKKVSPATYRTLGLGIAEGNQ